MAPGKTKMGPGQDNQGSALLAPEQQKSQLAYLYCIVSEVVEALSFVIKILTMLNRNTKFIWKKKKERKKIQPVSQIMA